MKSALILTAIVMTACVTGSSVREKHDPQEDDPRLRAAFKEAAAYAERETSKSPPYFGQIHEYWRLQKEFLLRKYGIRWKDPEEMNPGTFYD